MASGQNTNYGLYRHMRHYAIVIADVAHKYPQSRYYVSTYNGIWFVRWEDGDEQDCYGEPFVVVNQ
jgi:hypothetical protein